MIADVSSSKSVLLLYERRLLTFDYRGILLRGVIVDFDWGSDRPSEIVSQFNYIKEWIARRFSRKYSQLSRKATFRRNLAFFVVGASKFFHIKTMGRPHQQSHSHLQGEKSLLITDRSHTAQTGHRYQIGRRRNRTQKYHCILKTLCRRSKLRRQLFTWWLKPEQRKKPGLVSLVI